LRDSSGKLNSQSCGVVGSPFSLAGNFVSERGGVGAAAATVPADDFELGGIPEVGVTKLLPVFKEELGAWKILLV
jgi:hypothetical protein